MENLRPKVAEISPGPWLEKLRLLFMPRRICSALRCPRCGALAHKSIGISSRLIKSGNSPRCEASKFRSDWILRSRIHRSPEAANSPILTLQQLHHCLTTVSRDRTCRSFTIVKRPPVDQYPLDPLPLYSLKRRLRDFLVGS